MDPHAVSISLLGGFNCAHAGNVISLPLGAQRLLALLAIRGDGAHRGGAAERLWPDCSATRAAGNLRSALWKGRRVAETTVIECFGSRLRMSPSVLIDLHDVQRQAQDALESPSFITAPERKALVASLSRELLPEWSEDWLVVERERWDQVRIYALEAMADRLRSGQDYLGAMTTALAAIAVEPIRETAHRIVIEVHLAEGNAASALVHYQRYRSMLQRELGVAPSPQMARLVSTLMPQ